MQRETREVWAKRVERLCDSGLTTKEFAAETGVNAHTLSWWRARLGARAKQRPAREAATSTRRASSPPPPPPPPPVTFVELATSPSAPSAPLSVVLTSGHEIRVPIGFDAPTFERLLGLLERSA